MTRLPMISLVILLGIALAACSGPTNPTAGDTLAPPASTSRPTGAPAPALQPAGSDSSSGNLAQTKDEAAVSVTVTPLNLGDAVADTLDFEVALNTHSVDLAYDMLSIVTLRMDTGEEVQPAKWDGPAGGGHHMSGTLSFPQLKDRGQSVTLILRCIAGVPERRFEWEVK